MGTEAGGICRGVLPVYTICRSAERVTLLRCLDLITLKPTAARMTINTNKSSTSQSHQLEELELSAVVVAGGVDVTIIFTTLVPEGHVFSKGFPNMMEPNPEIVFCSVPMRIKSPVVKPSVESTGNSEAPAETLDVRKVTPEELIPCALIAPTLPRLRALPLLAAAPGVLLVVAP